MPPRQRPGPVDQTTVHLPCRDALGREHKLAIVVRGSNVTIHTPPGEVAILDVDATLNLATAARNAAALVMEAQRSGEATP